jgi:hypothetical protein
LVGFACEERSRCWQNTDRLESKPVKKKLFMVPDVTLRAGKTKMRLPQATAFFGYLYDLLNSE